jgi:hypothetical protein
MVNKNTLLSQGSYLHEPYVCTFFDSCVTRAEAGVWTN